MKLIKLVLASTFMLIATMTLALLASPVAANAVLELEISIEPDGSPNAINTQANGLIPVAILGT